MTVLSRYLFADERSKCLLYASSSQSVLIHLILSLFLPTWSAYPTFRNDGDPEMFAEAVNFYEMTIQMMNSREKQLRSAKNVASADSLLWWIDQITARYLLDPTPMYGDLRDTIFLDSEILTAYGEDQAFPADENMRIRSIFNKLMFWVAMLESKIQHFVANPQDPEMGNFVKKCRLMCNINDVIFLKLQDYMNRWRMHQKTNVSDPPFQGSNGLEMITGIFQEFSTIVYDMRRLLNQMYSIGFGDGVQEALNQNANLFCMLINESIFVDVQPPQVLRTNTIFVTQLRFFINPNYNFIMFSDQHGNPVTQVHSTISVVNKEQAQHLIETNSFPDDFVSQSDITENSNGVTTLHEQGKFIAISFNNKQLSNIRRTERRGSESVTEEKFAILYQICFNIDGQEFNICKFSLPIVVIVHGNQEIQASSTIFWDNAFTSLNRMSFDAPLSVPWSTLADALNTFIATRMRIAGGFEGRRLTEDNLNCLAEKLNARDVNSPVTWNSFARADMPGRSFTFWKWFYEAFKLLSSDHLSSLWQNNRINGFIQKGLAERLLIQCEPGTFLVRFSDSTLGAISIAAACRKTNGQHGVNHLNPFDKKALAADSLPKRVAMLANLVLLYPDLIPKNVAFDINAQVIKVQPGYVNAEQRMSED